MTNIKNNKLLHKTLASSFSESTVAVINAAPAKAATANVPFFKNPHKTIAADSLLQQSATKSTASSFSDSTVAVITAADYKPNLMFLQKKGSQIPNPNIISYNFPSSNSSASVAVAYNVSPAAANVYKLLFNFFKSMYCLISKPVFIQTPDKIKIQLFYFLLPASGVATANQRLAKQQTSRAAALAPAAASENLIAVNLTKIYPYKFKLICTILSKFFNKNVELELIRLHQPYYDSNILVNFLALIINKKNIGACIQRLFNSNIIKANKVIAADFLTKSSPAADSQAYLSGLNIKISGRLMREPIIPRITTKKFEKGFTAKGKINYFDLARFTHKNRKGAFTITVKSGQNF